MGQAYMIRDMLGVIEDRTLDLVVTFHVQTRLWGEVMEGGWLRF